MSTVGLRVVPAVARRRQSPGLAAIVMGLHCAPVHRCIAPRGESGDPGRFGWLAAPLVESTKVCARCCRIPAAFARGRGEPRRRDPQAGVRRSRRLSAPRPSNGARPGRRQWSAPAVEAGDARAREFRAAQPVACCAARMLAVCIACASPGAAEPVRRCCQQAYRCRPAEGFSQLARRRHAGALALLRICSAACSKCAGPVPVDALAERAASILVGARQRASAPATGSVPLLSSGLSWLRFGAASANPPAHVVCARLEITPGTGRAASAHSASSRRRAHADLVAELRVSSASWLDDSAASSASPAPGPTGIAEEGQVLFCATLRRAAWWSLQRLLFEQQRFDAVLIAQRRTAALQRHAHAGVGLAEPETLVARPRQMSLAADTWPLAVGAVQRVGRYGARLPVRARHVQAPMRVFQHQRVRSASCAAPIRRPHWWLQLAAAPPARLGGLTRCGPTSWSSAMPWCAGRCRRAIPRGGEVEIVSRGTVMVKGADLEVALGRRSCLAMAALLARGGQCGPSRQHAHRRRARSGHPLGARSGATIASDFGSFDAHAVGAVEQALRRAHAGFASTVLPVFSGLV